MSIEKVTQENIPVQSSGDAMLLMIDRVCSDPSFDVSKMEKLVEMRNAELARVAEINFNNDFASMQAELPVIPCNGRGHNNSKYALKADMVNLTKPFLQKYGFSLSFTTSQESGYITTKATLRHKDGHSISTELKLKDDNSGSKNVVQAIGSSQAYGERYTMKGILNLAISDDIADDDGNGAVVVLATAAQRTAIANLYMKLTPGQKKSFDDQVGGVAEIRKQDVDSIMARLNKSIKERN